MFVVNPWYKVVMYRIMIITVVVVMALIIFDKNSIEQSRNNRRNTTLIAEHVLEKMRARLAFFLVSSFRLLDLRIANAFIEIKIPTSKGLFYRKIQVSHQPIK